MRKLLYSSLFLLAVGCKQSEQNTLDVKGALKNAGDRTVYLEESSLANLQPVIVDSARLDKDGNFHLETLTKEEAIFSLRLDEERFPLVSFINDEKEVTINADLKSAELYTIKGSPASQELKAYLEENSRKMQALYLKDKDIDSLRRQKVSDSLLNRKAEQRMTAVQALKTYTLSVINQSKSPALTLFALGSYQSMASNPNYGLEGFSQQEVNNIVAQAAKKFPSHTAIASLNKDMQARATAGPETPAASALLNKPAPDFTFPDVNGKPVALSSFKGKYVLVDFWASWCPPCRAENPNVVKAYNKFKNKNFTVLGVSLDRPDGKDKWIEAIKEDGLAWTQVSDLKFWDSQVVGLYGFDGIPYNVLVDPKGVVIAESLRGEDLERKLSEVLH
ncbi:TlpA family protein disulfide reductase [Paraflavisolibacter sp. H34]|uniref:TlpA family protein disulfide reductase n=1 Tax=Huijunlia imazamoxiresistens TaxID=3127457 RepID=UPI00301AFF62